MPKPAHTVDKVQPDRNNNNLIFDICPTMMTDTNKTYKADMPTLTQDETIVVESELPKVVDLL